MLKLNNHPWKKVWNKFFVEKNDTKISGFAVVKKSQVLQKKFFLKKNTSSLFEHMRSSKQCEEIFLK